jgi:hypothetical protein
VVQGSSAWLRQPWRVLPLARQPTEQDPVWRVKPARVWRSSGSGWSAGTYWLLGASNDATGAEQVFLSNAGAGPPVAVLVRVAFRRATGEPSFRVGKPAVGFAPVEGRSAVGLMRHLRLCLAALGFVAEHTERLRGETPGTDEGAGVPGAGRGGPRVAPAAAGDE